MRGGVTFVQHTANALQYNRITRYSNCSSLELCCDRLRCSADASDAAAAAVATDGRIKNAVCFVRRLLALAPVQFLHHIVTTIVCVICTQFSHTYINLLHVISQADVVR